jgi:CRP-like cAMP-binding protein
MLHQDRTEQHLLRDHISMDELFNGLNHGLREDLAAVERHKHVSHNNIVFASGDAPGHIYVHRSGRAVLFQEDGRSDTVYSCPVEADRLYGVVEALSGHAFEISMKTLTDSEFEVIDRDAFLDLVRRHPDLCFRLAEILSRMYQNALQSVRSH